MFCYKDIKEKIESFEYVPGYEVSWVLILDLLSDYERYNKIGIAEVAIRAGYYMGLEAGRAEARNGGK